MNQLAHTPTEYASAACIDACSHCHQVCLQTAMNICSESAEKLVKTTHFRLLINCAEICQTSENFQLSNSQFQHQVCEVCAVVCESCAAECQKVGGMNDCEQACLDCAKSCREMSNTRH